MRCGIPSASAAWCCRRPRSRWAGLFQKALLAVMSRVAPDVAVEQRPRSSRLSHDAAVVRAYVDDPLVHDRISRGSRFWSTGARRARARRRCRCRRLLIYAGDDRLVDPEGSREFARRAPRSLLVAREYPALWHEILNESPEGRSAVLADLERWLAQRNAPGAADASPSG